MLVEMVKMRQGGRKFAPQQLRDQAPIRGELSIYLRHEKLMAAVLPDQRLPDDVPSLEEPRLTRMQGDSFVLVGFERTDLHRGGNARHQQAWWCRLVGVRASTTAPADPSAGSPHSVRGAACSL